MSDVSEKRGAEATGGEAASGIAGRLQTVARQPWLVVAAVGVVALLLGWQFITDPTRGVPAFDEPFYQWRAEYLQQAEPQALIALRGARGALAGGYRVAEPVLGALMRTVGGLGASTPTIVLSVLFRVICALGLAAFAWRHRKSWLLFYITLFAVPALFLLQRFFGFLDNFFALAVTTGVLLLLEPLRRNWFAWLAVAGFLFIGGLTHPTSLALFLLAIGAVAGYRLLRERSLAAVLHSEGWLLLAGTVAVVLTAAFWMGGLWGEPSSFGDAAVPPPEDVDFFVNRSLGVFRGLQPEILIPIAAIGFVYLVYRSLKKKDSFAEVTVAWTLPLVGMFGFLIGAAYPYFRFFNGTLAPLVVAAVGLWLLAYGPSLLRRRAVAKVGAGIGVVAVAAILFGWWSQGLQDWNSSGSWLTPELREQTAAADGYLGAEPANRQAVFVVDAQPGEVVSYGKYKEAVNGIYAGLAGERIGRTTFFFGRIEDFSNGTPTTTGDEVYDEISRETAEGALVFLMDPSNVVVFVPAVFNEHSPNAEFLEDCPATECRQVGESGLFVLTDPGAGVSEPSLETAERAAAAARSFVASPPGFTNGLGSTLLAIFRLVALFGLPGYLLWRGFPERRWLEGLVLVPLLSITMLTTVGVFLLAAVRQPFGEALGWLTWGIASAVGGLVALQAHARRNTPPSSGPSGSRVAQMARDTLSLFGKRDFTFLMGTQWFAQAADGLVGVALAKHIVFGGQAGFSLEEARSPEDILRIALLTFLPYAVLSPFFGVLIDRFDRRRLLVGANAIRTVAIIAIAVLGIERLTDSPLGDGVLFGSFLLVLAGTRLMLAIKGAGVPAVLGERDLIQGNSISQAGSAIFQLGGAGTALVAATFVPSEPIILIGALGYAVATASAWAIGRLGYADRSTPLREEVRRIARDLAEGIKEVLRRPRAGLALTSFLGIRTLLSFVLISIALASREFLAARSDVTTAIPAVAGALGAAVGFFAAHAMRERVSPVRIVVGALMFAGAGVVAFGGIITLAGLSLVGFVVGVGFFLGKVGADTLMQQSLEDSFRGRGFGLQDLVYNLSWILPALVVSALWSDERARALLIGGGVLFLAWGALIALWARTLPAESPAHPPRR